MGRIARAAGSGWFLAVSAVLLWAWFYLLALSRWNLGLAYSYDLGIFIQIAQDYARFRLPEPNLLGYPVFGDHFSPINVLWGLAWLVWPDPRSLLVLQAAGIAAGVVIMAQTARRLLPKQKGAAPIVVVLGGLGAQTVAAAVFDVHEVGLGLVPMALLCTAMLMRRPTLLVVSSLLLICVKEDLGLTVIAAGALWVWLRPKGQRVVGVVVMAIGALGAIVAAATISSVSRSGTSPQAGFFVGQAWAEGGFTEIAGRLVPVVLFIAAAGIAGVTSRLVLLSLPTLGWRFVSSKVTHWSFGFHYDLMLWPIAIACLIDVYQRWWSRPGGRVPVRDNVFVGSSLILVVATGVAIAIARVTSFAGILGESPKVVGIREVASQIPPAAAVAAVNTVGAYLLPQHDVYAYLPDGSTTGVVEYLVVEADAPYALEPCAQAAYDRLLATGRARVIAKEGGLEVVQLAQPERLTASCP